MVRDNGAVEMNENGTLGMQSLCKPPPCEASKKLYINQLERRELRREILRFGRSTHVRTQICEGSKAGGGLVALTPHSEMKDDMRSDVQGMWLLPCGLNLHGSMDGDENGTQTHRQVKQEGFGRGFAPARKQLR